MTEPLKFIVESLLFVSEEPLSVQQLKTILDDAEPADIRAALSRQAVQLLEEVEHDDDAGRRVGALLQSVDRRDYTGTVM